MPSSMTGYGKAEAVYNDRRFTVEIKSINHRYADINIKLPRILAQYEEMIRKTVASQVQRGKTDVYIGIESLGLRDLRMNVNTALADAYAAEFKSVSERYKLTDELRTSDILRFPDVLSIERCFDESDDELLRDLKATLEEALNAFMRMRRTEGEHLAADILSKREKMLGYLETIKARSHVVVKEYSDKLRERMNKLMADVIPDKGFDEGRIVTEVAIMADRMCIDEEIVRLGSHLHQLSDILGDHGHNNKQKNNESVGRKLDFLAQEINREINTIGSKTGDIDITKLVIELKSETEKIREQVQNIE